MVFVGVAKSMVFFLHQNSIKLIITLVTQFGGEFVDGMLICMVHVC